MVADTVRVASIPAIHPYVQHLAAPDGPSSVIRLADPVPLVADPMPGQWWPPAMLARDWVAEHHGEFDLMHLHFGFDTAEPSDIVAWCDELSRWGRPLVMTVHDLMNPHFEQQQRHRELLDLLIPRADRLITLTDGAAAEIHRRWGRQATVIPHPHIVALEWQPDFRGHDSDEFVIGLHAKSLRANVDPLPVLAAIDVALPEMPQATVRVDLHPDIAARTDKRAVALREWLDSKAGDHRWQVHSHPMFTDQQLWQYLSALDLYVLPYRFGTHSGWLEACVDVDTGVLVPDIGYYAEQHGHPVFARDADGAVDEAGFVAALRRVYADHRQATPPPPDRRAQRRRIAADHERVYRSAF